MPAIPVTATVSLVAVWKPTARPYTGPYPSRPQRPFNPLRWVPRAARPFNAARMSRARHAS